MTDIGELKVTIKANAAQLEREMGRVNAIVQQSSGGMSASLAGLRSSFLALAPALGVAALLQFGKDAAAAAGHMVDLSERVGFAVTTLAALETPLAASGASLDEFTGAINRMNNVVGEAAKGNEEAIRAFDQLGLSVDKLRRLSPEEQFYEIAGALGRIKDQSTQTEAGMNVFGRTFAVLLPLLKEYEGDMRKAVGAQKELNDGLSPEALKRIDEFGDSLSAAGIRIRNSFLEGFAAVLQFIDKVTEAEGKLPANASYDRPKTVNSVTRDPTAIDKALRDRGLIRPDAKGDNRELLARIQAQKDALKGAKEQADATETVTAKTRELDRAALEAAQTQALFHDRLTRGLTDMVFSANSARDAFKGLADEIARMVFERKVAGPLIDGLVGKNGGSGLIDSLLPAAGNFFGGFFADGGRPPMGKVSVVGERGPEIFVPDTRGTVVPNHKLGGNTVNVYQTIQLSPGMPELINARIREAAPVIAAQAQAATLQAMRQGGDASRIIGARS